MRTPLPFLLAILSGGAALAQVDHTGTGGGPLSTRTAPYTTANGTTKPPSRDASPTRYRDLERRTADERRSDRIEDSICVGCGLK